MLQYSFLKKFYYLKQITTLNTFIDLNTTQQFNLKLTANKVFPFSKHGKSGWAAWILQ